MARRLQRRAGINRGAYESPHSGIGMEFDPWGVTPDNTGLVLHETGFLRNNCNWHFPNVLSPFWRFYYNSRPGHSLVFGDTQVELAPDRIVLINDHQVFHCLGKRPVPHFWMTFSVLNRVKPEQKIPIILSPDNLELALIHNLSSGIEQGDGRMPAERIKRLSLALLNIVLSRPEIKWQDELPARLEMIVKSISCNVNMRMSNASLARRAGISVEGLIRLFKEHLGITPAAYVTQVRIRTASQMLLQTEDSIDQIAEALSFADRAHFSRTFKKVTGQSPATFRKR